MLVNGVRNSWATSPTRLRRRSSVRDSSASMVLNVRANSLTSSLDCTWALTVKSRRAACLDTRASVSTGLNMRWETKNVRIMATPTASKPLRISSRLSEGPELSPPSTECGETPAGTPGLNHRVPKGPSAPETEALCRLVLVVLRYWPITESWESATTRC